MATTNNLRPLLHRKQWEVCAPLPTATINGAFMRWFRYPDTGKRLATYTSAVNTHWLYEPTQDAWMQLVNSGSAGTFGAGACGRIHPMGPSGTATAGSTTTLTTNLTLYRDLRGYKIRITGGPGAGDERMIASNTIGGNSVITVTSTFSATITSSSTYVLLTPRLWYFCPSTSAPGFNYYCYALNTWTTRSVTNVATSFGTDGSLCGTPAILSGALDSSSGKVFSACTSTVLTLTSGSNWTASQWINSQIRVTAGTGAGQVRTISANTNLTLTVSSSWTTPLDGTSQWQIEGNDDYLYLIGNNALVTYRYSISGNSWSSVASRAGNAGAGSTLHWIASVPDATWQAPNAILNGRYLYSLRGAGTATLDRYDIAANTWTAVAYGNNGAEVFNTGACADYDEGRYIYIQGTNLTTRLYRFDILLNQLEPWAYFFYGHSTSIVGDKLTIGKFVDGATTIPFIYLLRQSATEFFRMMVID